MTVLGTFILAFGWFGFNAGSTLSGMDTRIAVIAVNTMLASASGAFGAYLWMKLRFGTPDVSMLCNGMLAGHGRDHRAVRVRDRAGGDLHRRGRRRAGDQLRRCSSRTC